MVTFPVKIFTGPPSSLYVTSSPVESDNENELLVDNHKITTYAYRKITVRSHTRKLNFKSIYTTV